MSHIRYLTLVMLFCRLLQAQGSNEVGLVIGATTTPSFTSSPGLNSLVKGSGDISFKPALALGAEFDHRLFGRSLALLAGLDFLASPMDLKLDRRPASAIPEYAFVYLTPHVKMKLNSEGALQPWLSFGGGYARFRGSTPTIFAGNFRQGSNTGTLEFGGGLDTKPVIRLLHIPIGVRLEIRDFYSGTPNYNVPALGRQNTVAYTGGLLLRF